MLRGGARKPPSPRRPQLCRLPSKGRTQSGSRHGVDGLGCCCCGLLAHDSLRRDRGRVWVWRGCAGEPDLARMPSVLSISTGIPAWAQGASQAPRWQTIVFSLLTVYART